MKKAMLLLSAAALLTLSLSGCGGTSSNGSSQSSSSVSSSAQSGVMTYSEDAVWPAKQMKNLPKPDGVVSAVTSNTKTFQCAVVVTELSYQKALAYFQKLKSAGFGGTESTDEDAILLTGVDNSGNGIFFSYNKEEKTGTVIYTPVGTSATSIA